MIEISLDGTELKKEIQSRVKNAVALASDVSANYAVTELQKAFDNEGARRGRKKFWIPTSIMALLKRKTAPKGGTLEQRMSQIAASNPKTLVDTGQLRDSITILEDKQRGLGKELKIGASDSKIVTHELGGEIQGNEIPIRANQFLTDADVNEITRVFKGALKQL
jgi:phage gpG-like protein